MNKSVVEIYNRKILRIEAILMIAPFDCLVLFIEKMVCINLVF